MVYTHMDRGDEETGWSVIFDSRITSGESEGKEEKKKKIKNGLEFIVERVLAFWSK